jgi:hypothetical protein
MRLPIKPIFFILLAPLVCAWPAFADDDPSKMKERTFEVSSSFEHSFDGQPAFLGNGDKIRVRTDGNIIAIPIYKQFNGKHDKKNIVGWIKFNRSLEINGKKVFNDLGDTEPDLEFLNGTGALYSASNGKLTEQEHPKKFQLKQTAFLKVSNPAGGESIEAVAIVKFDTFKDNDKKIKGGERVARHQDLFKRESRPSEPAGVSSSLPEALKELPPALQLKHRPELEAIPDPQLCPGCRRTSRIPDPLLSGKQIALDNIKKLVMPMVGLHIGDCKLTNARLEDNTLFKGLRALLSKAKDNKSLAEGIKLLNDTNRDRKSAGEKIDDDDKKAVVPPPQLRDNYTAKDVLSADVCTRTCVAEMGGQIPSRNDANLCRVDDHGEFDPRYLIAVVANLNNRKRKVFSESHIPRDVPVSEDAFASFANRTTDPIMSEPFINVQLKPHQYSNWLTSRKNRTNHSRSLCPPNPSGENLISKTSGPGKGKFFSGGQMPIQDIQPLDQKAFETCATQCVDAVFDPDKFWKNTNTFDALFYASPSNWKTTDNSKDFVNSKAHAPGCPAYYTEDGKKKRDISRCLDGRKRKTTVTTIAGKPLDKLRCMTFYDEAKVQNNYPWVDTE